MVAIEDTQLGAPTPCELYRVGELLEHVTDVTVSLLLAARKIRVPAGITPAGRHPAARARSDVRRRLPVQLDQLVTAWRDPDAWTGETEAAGVRLPARDMGLVALDELVVHGWDLARATGRPFPPDDASIEPLLSFSIPRAGAEHATVGTGRGACTPAEASPLERVLALRGRDPAWRHPDGDDGSA